MRRATARVQRERAVRGISIHALHEESDGISDVPAHVIYISIHALHEESDYEFDSMHVLYGISIHALHEESDSFRLLNFLHMK